MHNSIGKTTSNSYIVPVFQFKVVHENTQYIFKIYCFQKILHENTYAIEITIITYIQDTQNLFQNYNPTISIVGGMSF